MKTNLLEALKWAESFLSGFEGDEEQEASDPKFQEKLDNLRKVIEEQEEPVYVGTYLYIHPDDTVVQGEKPNTEVRTFMGPLEEVMDSIQEHFDGLETFEKYFKPEIRKHFEEDNAKYFGDDYSAGQWFEIAQVNEGTIKEISL